jgi:hypothetical protein
MNWYIIIPIGILILVLVYFLVTRNIKDEKNFEDQLNNDFKDSTKSESDIESEDQLH